MAETRHILWSASLPPVPLPERIDVAAAAGYEAVSVSPADAAQLRSAGLAPAAVRRAADASGVDLAVLDAFVDWYPYPPPRRTLPLLGVDAHRFFADAEELGVRTVTALAPYPTDAPLDRLVEGFAAFCDRAATAGLDATLEFTPFPPVADLRTAWAIVDGCGRPNARITLDAWHFFRGADPDLDLLASLPPGVITAVQLADGAAELRSSLAADTFRHRLVPGEGVFDLAALTAAVDPGGAVLHIGAEVLNDELFALPAAVVAARLAGAGRRYLPASGSGPDRA